MASMMIRRPYSQAVRMVRIAKRSQGRLFSMQRADIDKYCMENVKSHDYESFLGGLLFPKEYRGLYFALHAFNVEIATIRDQVPRNSTNAARIRFLFWKDVFQQIYGGSGLSPSNNQPVAQALSYYIKEHKLTSRWFERALEARFQDAMGSTEFSSMDDLESYAEYSQSSLLYLLLEAMQVRCEPAEFAASHVGVCKGIVTLLRGHELHRSQGACYFPSEVMKKHGLPARAALHGPQSAQEVAALQDVVNDIASQAHAHLSKARELLAQGGDWPATAHFALLPAVGSQLYLDALQRDNFLPQEGNQHMQFVKLQMRLLKYLLVKKF